MNRELFLTINGMAGHWKILDWVGIGLATATPYFFILVVVILHLLSLSFPKWQGYWKTTIAAGIGAGVAVLLSKITSFLFPEPRPFVEGVGHLLIHHSPDNSFPSDHTTFLVAVALPFLLNRHWKLGAILACLALLGGVARVFVGVHWPVDILGGVVVGTVGGIIGWKVTEKGGRWLFQLWGLEQKVLKTIREGGQW